MAKMAKDWIPASTLSYYSHEVAVVLITKVGANVGILLLLVHK